MSKSPAFKSPVGPPAATALVLDTLQETESEMEISMTSEVTHHPSSTSPSQRLLSVTSTTSANPVLDQFQQMRSMVSRFLGAHQVPIASNHQGLHQH